MKKNSKKKKLMAAAAALALIAAISGTFAWITAQDQKINRVNSAAVVDDSVTVNETWEPKPLVAGTSATKQVSVTNSGSASAFVRISYEEVLKHLVGEGAKSYTPSTGTGNATDPKYTYVEGDLGLNKHMPINVNAAKDLTDGFEEVPTSAITYQKADGTPETNVGNVMLLVKGGKVYTELTGKSEISYTYKVVHRYFTHPTDATQHKYQEVTLDAIDPVIPTANEDSDAKDWTFTLKGLNFGYYANGYENSVVNWAESSLPDRAGSQTGHSLLGTSGQRHDVEYDYTATATGFGTGFTIPGPTPATATGQIPTSANATAGIQADLNGFGEDSIQIGYSADIANIADASLADEKWVYNPEDGWFYYTSPLAGSKTTKNIMEELIFGSDLGVKYTNASYDLIVKMEAIQATPAAMTDSAGWGLTVDDTRPNTKKIYEKLNPAPATP